MDLDDRERSDPHASGFKSMHRSRNDSDDDADDMELDLAIAKATIGITMRGALGECHIEESVYGAALVIPQLARTSGWNKTWAILAIRSYFFLLLNLGLQTFFLMMIAKEELVMDPYSGQMYLCDFGSNVEGCPGPGCIGPGGTEFTASRLYKWDTYMERNFVKDALKAVFPDKLQEIEDKIDPGEYGIEGYWCRFACCFIFMVTCTEEFVKTFKLADLLYQIPSMGDPWIKPNSATKTSVTGAIDHVHVEVAGMPFFWKIINLVVIVLPKLWVWYGTACSGITFLMETSGIDNIIVNSVALTFILNIDEMLLLHVMSEEIANFLKATKGYALYDIRVSSVGDMSLLTEEELLLRYRQSEFGLRSFRLRDVIALVPGKLVISIVATAFFVFHYYYIHCTLDNQSGTTRLVSQSMYLPKSAHFDWLNAFLPSLFPIQHEEDAYWQMPHG